MLAGIMREEAGVKSKRKRAGGMVGGGGADPGVIRSGVCGGEDFGLLLCLEGGGRGKPAALG